MDGAADRETAANSTFFEAGSSSSFKLLASEHRALPGGRYSNGIYWDSYLRAVDL
jgi:hypothetical protein